MASVRRRPSEYRTSFPLEELSLTYADGSELHLAQKRLDWDALDEQARAAKPRFLHDPAREPAVYSHVLPHAPAGPPRYYGTLSAPAADGHRLFVEWVEGRELYQVGERRIWEAAASWLAGMHLALAPELDRHCERGRLLRCDAAYYRRWIERADGFARSSGRADALRGIERIAERYEEAIKELGELPRTVIHGEFYASNVLACGDVPHPRIAPVDWELAAVGPGVVDLAALTSGRGWNEVD